MCMPSRALVLALLVAFASPRPAAAQEYDAFEAYFRLERRQRASPTDPRLLCELGWARHRLHLDEELRVIAAPGPLTPAMLDRGIALYGAPTEAAQERRLAACLYSRGRVAETTDLAAAIPFYERSLALRTSDAVRDRLDGARRAVAAAWAPIAGDELEPSIATELAALPEPGAELEVLGHWRSAAGDDLYVLSDGARLFVAFRPVGGVWSTTSPPQAYEGSAAGSAWIEAPVDGEALRVVATWTRETRVTGEDGYPEYGAYVQASTIAIGTDGALREISTDPWW